MLVDAGCEGGARARVVVPLQAANDGTGGCDVIDCSTHRTGQLQPERVACSCPRTRPDGGRDSDWAVGLASRYATAMIHVIR